MIEPEIKFTNETKIRTFVERFLCPLGIKYCPPKQQHKLVEINVVLYTINKGTTGRKSFPKNQGINVLATPQSPIHAGMLIPSVKSTERFSLCFSSSERPFANR